MAEHERTVGVLDATPVPDDEEAAAIVAAYQALRPPPAVVAPPEPQRGVWRFSGRWWARPIPARRDRPWH